MINDDHDESQKIHERNLQINVELKELMNERRQLLRELGDLSARRGQEETELNILIKQSNELRDAHDDALADIEEAEMIRARLRDEPLAQALLGEEASFKALGPVLERLEHSRSLGYSVTLLDRAVERGLQVIQNMVEHVAKTPRYLLSNEVMELLERQSPDTAGTVRGLTRWSVQQRLETRLAETVSCVVIDLERLLEDYEMSITMLRRLRQVLEQLRNLGAPANEIETLLQACTKPEALPTISNGARGLITRALDDIYLESDQRDAGSAVALEQTVQVLEELISQIDATGLSSGSPHGPLWDFQRSGILPFEEVSGDIPPPVAQDALEDMNTELDTTPLIVKRAASVSSDMESNNEVEPIDSTREPVWDEMPEPEDNPQPDKPVIAESIKTPTAIVETGNEADERSRIEEELARIDAAWDYRNESEENETVSSDELTELEDDLKDLEL